MKVYCDSSFDEKRKIAGIGITIIDGQKQRTFSNWTRCRTNNAGELFAIYVSGILAEQRGVVYSDSQTAIDYIQGNIKDKPRTREQYINHLECKYWACKIRKLGVQVEKIKAHQHKFQTHSMGNSMADLLAKTGRSKFYER